MKGAEVVRKESRGLLLCLCLLTVEQSERVSRAAPASQPMVPFTGPAESGLFTCKGAPYVISSGFGKGEGEQ